MWPPMTDEPIAPGRGLPAYQPATTVLAGACRVPAAASPRWISPAETPIAGITSRVGAATGGPPTVCSGAGACGPVGGRTSLRERVTGVALWPVWLATANPVAPIPTATRPHSSTAAATGRRTTRICEVCRPGRSSCLAHMQCGTAATAQHRDAAGCRGQSGQRGCCPRDERRSWPRGSAAEAHGDRAVRHDLASGGILQALDLQVAHVVQDNDAVDRVSGQR